MGRMAKKYLKICYNTAKFLCIFKRIIDFKKLFI